MRTIGLDEYKKLTKNNDKIKLNNNSNINNRFIIRNFVCCISCDSIPHKTIIPNSVTKITLRYNYYKSIILPVTVKSAKIYSSCKIKLPKFIHTFYFDIEKFCTAIVLPPLLLRGDIYFSELPCKLVFSDLIYIFIIRNRDFTIKFDNNIKHSVHTFV